MAQSPARWRGDGASIPDVSLSLKIQEDRRIHLSEGKATIALFCAGVGSGKVSGERVRVPQKLYRAGKGDRMLSSWRDLGRIVFRKQRSGRKQKGHNEKLLRATQCVLEGLENRQMLSITLP